MRLLITQLAEQDLEEIGDYIANDNPTRAGSFLIELLEQCRRICSSPSAYRRRPDLSSEVRCCLHGNYVIFFEAIAEQVTILRISHRARDASTLLFQDCLQSAHRPKRHMPQGRRIRYPRPLDAPVAQLERVLPSEGRGRAFESRRAHH